MRYLNRVWLFLCITSFFALSSCQRDMDNVIPDNNHNVSQIITASPVEASVRGFVVDENNNPVQGASVRSGAYSTITDAKGLFRLNNIQLDKYASVVTVDQAGYFKGIRTFSAVEGSSNFLKLKLLPKSLIGNVDAAAGGTISLPDNSQISFLPNSFVIKSSGASYSGPVKVFARVIDPTASDIAQTVPGSFQALGANNTRPLLESYGMIAVQLESPSGELLQIATGKTARLRITIPASLSATAPSTMPLWNLDESDGLWRQEGEGTKTGNYYEADVKHFSFWNYDFPNNSVYFEVTVHTATGPLPDSRVKITRLSGGCPGYGYTDSSGHTGGFVLSNEPLLLEVVSNCDEVIYSQNLGSLTQYTNLGTITLTIPSQNTLSITGSAFNCSTMPVTNGNALIYFEGQDYLVPITNGIFSTTIIRCTGSNAAVDIIAVDNDSSRQSSTWTANASNGMISADSLIACGASTTEHVNYTVDGANFSVVIGAGSIPGNSIGIFVGTQGGPQFPTRITANYALPLTYNIDFTFNSPQVPGTYPLLVNSVNQYDSISVVNTFDVVVTAYGTHGDFIEGLFSGQFQENTSGILHNLSGNFRVRRP